MNKSNHIAVALANSGVDKVTPISSTSTPIQYVLVEFFRGLCDLKPWTKVVELLHLSDDTAKNRIKSSRDFTTEELADLIRSDHGWDVICAIHRANPGPMPKYFRLCSALMECADAQRLQAAARRKIRKVVDGAIDADQDLTAAIARADALLVHDEDFHRPGADALGAVARVSRGAVAPATKRR